MLEVRCKKLGKELAVLFRHYTFVLFSRMTKPAAEILQKFYLQLRDQSSSDGTPITARQLESLVRLAEARARVDLRGEITEQDAMVRPFPIHLEKFLHEMNFSAASSSYISDTFLLDAFCRML